MSNEIKLTEQEQVRRAKLEKYWEKGVDPFGGRYLCTENSQTLKEKYAKRTHEELEQLGAKARVAGRIMTLRRQGKVAFFHLQDRFGQIQGYIRKDVVGEEVYEVFKLADIGDIVGIEGTVMITNTGELTIRVEEYTHLTKALRPLPEKFHGLTDVEERYRRRYLDLIMNADAKRVALLRPRIIRSMQRYFDELGFVEVETSMLNPILGGAAARPFVTHHNALDRDFYLRIATELSLKKLLVGGLERVYEIGRLFRNEGMDSTHNPEFTTVELYMAYGNIEDMAEICEGVIRYIANETLNTTLIPHGDYEIDVKNPFRRAHMVDLIKEITGVDFWQPMSFEEARALADTHHVPLEKHHSSVGHIINQFFETFVEETLIQPTFVFGHPTEISPLAKKNKQDPRFTDRFELFIDGHEYANAFSELNDPIDQRERFEEQRKAKSLGDAEACDIDVDFVESLEYGMPPAGGIGIGIDRLVMLLANCTTIREVILFPTMKSLPSDK